ncbi:heavy-metal-associated domain-containing protein [Taibaiella chishuiensis]|uniref:Copper chaperone n=1 Tax=Taibaiella chishuiensis TaxID=1434707 RepID=A0A2P8D9H6_9BACT|nr:heavy-metal-associated domain-containing protein [Taibaiella chishuiensis]PSK93853.1 copper chaperone [Taibaiella chishuiensis]
MKNITLSIPGMQSSHCQSRVRSAIEAVSGATVENLAAGELTATVANNETTATLIQAIEKAGYKVSNDDEGSIQDKDIGCEG